MIALEDRAFTLEDREFTLEDRVFTIYNISWIRYYKITHTVVKLHDVDRTLSISEIYKNFSILGEEKAIKELIANIKKEK